MPPGTVGQQGEIGGGLNPHRRNGHQARKDQGRGTHGLDEGSDFIDATAPFLLFLADVYLDVDARKGVDPPRLLHQCLEQ